jgi:hypothetical protein
MFQSLQPGNPYWRGWLSTVDLLVPTNFDQLLMIFQTTFTFYKKQDTLMRRSIVLSLPLQLVFPATSCCLSAKPKATLDQYFSPFSLSRLGSSPQPGNTKGEVSLYHWPPVWLVWISLFCKYKQLSVVIQLIPNKSNRRSTVQLLSISIPLSIPCHNTKMMKQVFYHGVSAARHSYQNQL